MQASVELQSRAADKVIMHLGDKDTGIIHVTASTTTTTTDKNKSKEATESANCTKQAFDSVKQTMHVTLFY